MKLIIFFILFFTFLSASTISEYKAVNKSIVYKNKNYTILRSFKKDEKSYFLLVDEDTLKTKIVEKTEISEKETTFKNTRYKKLLNRYKTAPYKLQNFGVNEINSDNIYLTVDLCPSSKEGYEDVFFKSLSNKEKPTPITVFISGKWITKHQKEFLELIFLEKEKKVVITWGNHTFSHPYNPTAPVEKNFLLTPNINVLDEVLNLEKLLLSYDITPSILFRYPGLVSNEKISRWINSLGLIPIASNAWLAKDEKVKKGSVILVHGNKNEPLGIKKFYQLKESEKAKISSILSELN